MNVSDLYVSCYIQHVQQETARHVQLLELVKPALLALMDTGWTQGLALVRIHVYKPFLSFAPSYFLIFSLDVWIMAVGSINILV